jgi:phosphoglycolate phosphatase
MTQMSTSGFDFWMLDLDGTLVDVEESYIQEIVGEVGECVGASFDAWESEMLWYGPSEPRARILQTHGVDRERFWAAFHEVEEPESRAAATHLYPDAEAFLATVDAPVGLVTHCQEYLTGPVLDELDIADWFDTVLCCSEETGWKPDPEPIEMAMADLGVGHNGHHGAMVGDDPGDTGAAWNAGLSAIHVSRRDPERIGRCVRGDRRISSLTELTG